MPEDMPPIACPNCQEAVPEGVRLCPYCGANVPPLPHLVGKTKRDPSSYWTSSKRGDIMLGIAFGVFCPLAFALLSFGILQYPFWQHADNYQFAAIFFAFISPIALPFWIAKRIKSRKHIAGDAMQKTMWCWFALAIAALVWLVISLITNPPNF
ncbi:MAG: zinc-ribbon domain-containing protein [Armatimonadetes bacterium]|nr:zinc-ribbon domain-containing protein [Armatimonadota bacterium]